MKSILSWLNQPTSDICRRYHIIGLALIIAALTSLIFILGEGTSK